MDMFISREIPDALRRCADVTLAIIFSAWFSGFGIAQPIQTMDGRFAARDKIDTVPWHPEGLIAVLGDERGRKWDLYGRGLAVRPDGKQLAAGGGSGVIYLLNPTTLRIERVLHGHAKHILALQYSADGRTLASIGADKEVRIWDLSSEDGAPALPAVLDETPYCAVWSDDGTTLVIGRGHTQVLQVWRRSPQGPMQIFASALADNAAGGDVLRDELQGLAEILNARSIASIGSPASPFHPTAGSWQMPRAVT